MKLLLIASVLVGATVTSTVADPRPSPPKALWHVRGEATGGTMKYFLRAHRSTETRFALADLEHALETQVHAGEWVIDDGGVDDAAASALRVIAKQHRFIYPSTPVVTAQIVGGNHGSWVGPTARLALVFENSSPYTVKVSQLAITTCGGDSAVVEFKPITLAPHGKATPTIALRPLQPGPATIKATCVPDEWDANYQPDFDLV